MFDNLCRLAVVCALCICATASQYSSYKLVVGDGGYARLLDPAPSLTDLTLAAWVNITHFPHGVAPILTAVSPDARSQVAFFLRHDGLGVLWGGPPSTPRYKMDQVDRHPRKQWVPMETVLQKRQRRDAVDYSGGLGDIENIMADPRSGRSFDTWSPYSFVDVDTMGVADLEASPSGLNADLHLLPTRDGFSRSESYSDWTVVPYELNMQESDPYDLHVVEPEPRIITQPSGDDDFVVFNWNSPQQPKVSIPQSPNEWSPMWQPNKESPEAILLPVQDDDTKQPETSILAANTPGLWSSHISEVKLGPNHWNPYHIRGAAFTSSTHQQQPTTPTTTPRPKPTTTLQPRTTTPRIRTTTTPQPKATRTRTTPWPRRTTATARPTPANPKTSRPRIPSLTTSRSALRWRSSKRTTTTTTPIPPTVPQQNKVHSSTSQFTKPSITTTQRPQTREPNARSTASTFRQSTRMPLWKLIKQPSFSHSYHTKSDTQTTTTSTTTSTTTTQRPTTEKTITRKNLPRITATRLTTTRPRPVSAVRLTSQVMPTIKPQIMGQKSKVSIWSSTVETHKPNKEHNYQEKWNSIPQVSMNNVNKDSSVSITPYHVAEFNRAMEGLPTVKDGNTAIVYSVPITDVEAFNAMYQHYQTQLAPNPPQTTRAPAQIVEAHEEETNENQLGESNFQDGFSYQFPNEREAAFEETAAPAILTEEEAVLIPTEEPLPPTPSRSDIPIEEEAEHTKNPGEVIFKVVYQQPPTAAKTKHEDQHTVTLVVGKNEKIQEPQTTSFKPYTSESSTPSASTIQITEEYVVTIPSESKVKNDVKHTLSSSETAELPTSPESKYMPETPVLKDLSPESVETNTPIDSQTNTPIDSQTNTPIDSQTNTPIDSQSTVSTVAKEKIDVSATSGTQTIPTTEQSNIPQSRPTSITKTPSRSHPKEMVSAGENKSELQSNNFAVFHVREEDIPIYPGPEEIEEVYSVDELYQPEGILAMQDDVHPVSHYQEPSHLYHQQLPPEYKYEEAPRPIAYGGPLQQASNPKIEDIEDIFFSDDPQKLIEQGFLPQPVHYVSTQEEADQWMQEQYEKQPHIEERVFVVDSSDTVNAVPAVSSQATETVTTSQATGNFHFRKLPFDFSSNQWYHLAFTWSSRDNQVGVYINGELAGTLTNVLPGQPALAGGGLTILGQTLLPDLTDFDPTSQFIGEMSEINMWGQRLGSDAIRTLYQCRAHIPVSPVLSWHQLSMRFYSEVYIQENDALCGA